MKIAIVNPVGVGIGGREGRTPAAETPHAFTLVELLVVLAIISMLMAVLLPSLNAARERGRRTVCMANLHSLGQAITIYANENQDRLVPGDSPRSTAIWGKPTDALEGECGGPAGSRPVNLGHLVKAGTPPLPTGKETVLFCPSTRLAYGFTPPGEVPQQWGTDGTACISYVYDDALDGFGCDVCDSVKSLPLHKNTINFVRADGSVQAFRMQRVVFEEAIGSETVQEIMTRYVVCFPTAMIFRWLEQEAVDVVAARAFLSDPLDWYAKNSAATPRRLVHLADVANKPLVCDAIGHPVAASDLPNSGHG